MRTALLVLGHLWAAPFSALGLLLALVTLSRPYTTRGPALVFRMGPVARWAFRTFAPGFNVAAYTWGACIFTRDDLTDRLSRQWGGKEDMRQGDARLVRHELEHVYQAMRWGPLFPFLYLASMAIAAARGQRAYADCYFERQARAAEVVTRFAPRAGGGPVR